MLNHFQGVSSLCECVNKAAARRGKGIAGKSVGSWLKGGACTVRTGAVGYRGEGPAIIPAVPSNSVFSAEISTSRFTGACRDFVQQKKKEKERKKVWAEALQSLSRFWVECWRGSTEALQMEAGEASFCPAADQQKHPQVCPLWEK